MWILGETDELPIQFLAISARRILWRDYGEKLSGFSGDDAINALILNSAENKRNEYLQKKMSRIRNG